MSVVFKEFFIKQLVKDPDHQKIVIGSNFFLVSLQDHRQKWTHIIHSSLSPLCFEGVIYLYF